MTYRLGPMLLADPTSMLFVHLTFPHPPKPPQPPVCSLYINLSAVGVQALSNTGCAPPPSPTHLNPPPPTPPQCALCASTCLPLGVQALTTVGRSPPSIPPALPQCPLCSLLSAGGAQVSSNTLIGPLPSTLPLHPPPHPTVMAFTHLSFCCWHFRRCPVLIVQTPPPLTQRVLNVSHSSAVSVQALSNTDCGAHQRVDQLAEGVQHMGGVQRGPVPWQAEPAGGHAAGSPQWPV